MDKYLADLFKAVGDFAERIGSMPTSAVLALVCIGLAWYIYRVNQHHEEYDRKWGEIRTMEAVADARMADAIGRLADKMDKNHQDTLEIKFTLVERAKGAKNV